MTYKKPIICYGCGKPMAIIRGWYHCNTKGCKTAKRTKPR